MLTAEHIAAWPGKTIEGEYHPALWHMLDVAAVSQILLSRQADAFDPELSNALTFLIALHDIGKISQSFRDQILGDAGRTEYHSQLSFVILEDFDEVLGQRLGGTPQIRRELYAAVAGHHGGPPELDNPRQLRRRRKAIGSEARAAIELIIGAVAVLFPFARLDGFDEPEALSWRLSGLTVQADWIGSNPDWFPAQDPAISVPEYWKQSLERAQRAVHQAGLDKSSLRQETQILPAEHAPRPMQAATQQAALPEGPTLAIIEDATGAGKTEASLILAHRMMRAGKGQGILFALPTMATSNAMLERIEEVAPKVFDGRPSLGLSHGRARQNALFQKIQGNDGSDPDEPVTCGQWLAEDRRKLLLADIGVGTIDQALMAVLPTRFNTLRLWALSQKILIVDEAHSYDPFMEEELGRLLRFHAMLGGSAILMTATLPKRMRDYLAGEFQRGLGATSPAPIAGTSYPQLTLVGETLATQSPEPVPATCRDIPVHRISEADVYSLLLESSAKGAACVWIRNAVDDAISAVETLRARGVEAELLHARFTVDDRLRKERQLQSTFGKTGVGRSGKVLVATQVVEASLDLDFDLMISDLAPIGSLIQRAGRLWRHMDKRPAVSRPVQGPALYVLSPDPQDVSDARWLHRLLPSGAWVYALADQWRTAKAIFDAGVISAPDGLRDLIEAVHGDTVLDVPDPLEFARLEAEGLEMSQRGIARNQLLKPGGYLEEAQGVYDEDRFSTRLGVPQVTLWLARRGAGGLEPYGETWESSELRISRRRYEKLGGIDQDSPEIQAIKARWPEWRKVATHIAPVGESGVIAEGLGYDPELGLIFELAASEHQSPSFETSNSTQNFSENQYAQSHY